MFRPRVIPLLQLSGQGLVKTVAFKNPRYIGDPVNAVRVFNDLLADELIFVDIEASKTGNCIGLDFVQKVGEEADMPFAVGGGIKSIREIKDLLNAGAEKVVINSAAVLDPDLISRAADKFGSSALTVALDVNSNFWGNESIYYQSGKKRGLMNPVEFALFMEKKGAGELIVTSVKHEGRMKGFDLLLIRKVSEAVQIPVIAHGGAGSMAHLKDGITAGKASAVAAGSLFIYHGRRKAVLVNYPSAEELKQFQVRENIN